MSTNQAKNVLDFYLFTTKLKEIIRSGWKQWNVPSKRLESVAEHIFGTIMLAIAIDSEYSYDIDIQKVALMLSIHELEEIIISDITPFDGISDEQKAIMGHEAIKKVLSPLFKGYSYETLILEFDSRSTPEAKFAFMCDKLEANLMSDIYDKNGDCTYDNATEYLKKNPAIVSLSENGKYGMGDCFYNLELSLNRLDNNFKEVLKVAKETI